MSSVVVVDYGVGNIRSVAQAFRQLGREVDVTSDPKKIIAARNLVLPGVGAFKHAMAELLKRDLVQSILEYAASGKPLLGICVGMQVLFEKGFENGECAGVGLMPGKVERISESDDQTALRKLPHIGWNKLYINGKEHSLKSDWTGAVGIGESFYFVHSFMAVPAPQTETVAVCIYQGLEIPAIVRKNNIVGVQFHPEKSGQKGLMFLREYLSN